MIKTQTKSAVELIHLNHFLSWLIVIELDIYAKYFDLINGFCVLKLLSPSFLSYILLNDDQDISDVIILVTESLQRFETD